MKNHFWLGAGAAVALLVAGAVLALALSAGRIARVERNFLSFVEDRLEAGALVLIKTRQRVSIQETVPGRLFGDSALGQFLNIRSDAVIELSAWADLAFVVDFKTAEPWSLHYSGAGQGTLYIAAPPLTLLTPAVLTDSVEARASDRSIFLDEDKLLDDARASLTLRFTEAATALLDDPALRREAADALKALAEDFARRAGLKLGTVDVVFAPLEME
ncbi:MAG: hypothetical protein JW923_03530 [Spirochaetales bacterium]|nr:hypothetical protein [Spirochaetales bacterium]